MNGQLGFIILFCSLFILWITSKPFYYLSLRLHMKRVSRKLNFRYKDLHHSFEQMVYFINLPSHLPEVIDAKKEDIELKIDIRGLFYPEVNGIKVFLTNKNKSLFIAYIPVEDFRMPLLDKLEKEKKINEEDYRKIGTFKLLHPKTLLEMKEDIFKNLQSGHYSG
ncbi:hypothetical protein [Bacillus alkalicellulosilyticus]|uniref:hypothetical protein n=1 Tax=Alkalihalobacterium alkalicellulosilyticum TaxID=1912214 RepID=UPI000998B3B5|nr:hypothetical protein [Bacillus alkalicellulosilyticus]